MADYFISYTKADRDWAFWIAKELQALGHMAHVHEWEIQAGDDIYAWMERRHDAADHVLCVVSDDYLNDLKAPFSALERRAAQWQAASKRPRFALFAVVKPCKLPTLTDHIRRCELFGIPEDAARTRFRYYLTAPVPPGAVAFPGTAAAVSNIPIRVPTHFMGRDDALAHIAAALAQHEGRVAITALHGLRGVGKTTLAAAYAERHRGDYRATWWIRAQAETSMRADLVGLGIRLGWVRADDKEEPALAAVMERLRHEGEGLLLIYDNAVDADALKPHLPRGGAARVLVTSNAHAWRGVAVPVEIRVWPRETGADYLIARTGRSAERAAAEALSEALGGLPLAHEQAAAYCERLEISCAEYLKRFQAAALKLLDDKKSAPVEYHPDHAAEHKDRLTVAGTFTLAIAEAAKLHPAAEPLLVHAALLAPDPVPLFLFAEAREKFSEPLATALAGDGLEEAVAALRAFALVERETIVDERDAAVTTEAIRLHRLVREVAAARREGEAREEVRGALVAALAEIYPADGYNNPGSWPRCASLTPHSLTICETETADVTASGLLLEGVGSYFHGRAAYSEARLLFERALAIREKVGGARHLDTGSSFDSLGLLLQSQGDYAAAKPLFERALAIREQALGAEHPDTCTSLNNLALLLHSQGDYAGAKPLLHRALAIREKALGADHPETGQSLNALALLLHSQGDYAGAKPLFRRALAIREKAQGPDHPDTATSLNNLAMLLRFQGDVVGAKALYERALAIREKVLGPEHPDTGNSLNSLALLLHSQGDHAGALPLYERALAINEKALGPDHPDTATSLNNLAFVLQSQGDVAGAKLPFERALAINEKALGPDHPDTATSLNNLAFVLQSQGDVAGAKLLFERALAIREKALGAEHPDTGTSLNNLAALLRDQGDVTGALPLQKRAVAIGEKALEPDHPNTNRGRYNLARLLLAGGNAAEALSLSAAALAAHETALGDNHPWTKDSARATADALAALGRPGEAAALRTRHALDPPAQPQP